MFEHYDNQAEIDKVREMIEAISPNLKFSGFLMKIKNHNAVSAVYVTVPEKGNKEIINKLISNGFKKWLRKKGKSYGGWDANESYSMEITLKMHLPEPPKEG